MHPGCISVPISLNEIARNNSKIHEVEEKIVENKCIDLKEETMCLENAFSLEVNESSKELKCLNLKLDSQKTQLKQINIDLEDANKRLLDLQNTVEIKEQLIKELIKNRSTRELAKFKFRKKCTKLEQEYYKIRFQIAQAENVLHEKKHKGDLDFVLRQKTEIEKQKNLARHYEKRLRDIGMVKQMAGDSAKTVLELENSVLKSEKEILKIKDHIEKEENKKEKLKEDILKDEEKIKTLEGSTERLKRNSDIENSETMHLQILDIRSSSANDSTENSQELRQEIVNLRNAKDCLLDERKKLRDKYRKSHNLSPVEKRRILECDEGIEAIDAAIEYKNEVMCGRKSMDSICVKTHGNRGEQMLMDRLLHLSSDEMRTLLHKYFRKVIDLKESGRKMEQQIYELEQENESQGWRIQNLSQALQTQKIESERQKVALLRNHQERMHVMMRQFADESGSSGTESRSQLMPVPPPPVPCTTSRVTREKNKVIIRLNAPKKKTSSKSLIAFNQLKQ